MLPNHILVDIVQEGGRWVYWPRTNNGYYTSFFLREIAAHLSHLNTEINMDNYNASEEKEADQNQH